MDTFTNGDLMFAQVTLSALIVFAFNTLERWGVLPANTPVWIKRATTWLAALIAALGLHWNFEATTGEFALSGSVQGVAHGVWIWLQSIVAQEGAHKISRINAALRVLLASNGK